MRMRLRGLVGVLALGAVGAVASTSHAWVGTYEMAIHQDAFIRNPAGCGPNISDGNGDLVENGKQFRGKCNEDVQPPSIGGINNNYLRFKTLANASAAGSKDRVELALTQQFFPFRENVYLGFRIRIPDNSKVVGAGKSHIVMQLWQKCDIGAPPIAGIRVTAGTQRTLQFFTKDDAGSNWDVPHEDIHLTGGWHEFVVMYNVNPRNGDGIIKLWKDGQALNQKGGGDNVYNDSYGYFTKAGQGEPRCHQNNGSRPPQEFRLKYGIYKDAEAGNGESFVVHYDEFTVGPYFSTVKPW